MKSPLSISKRVLLWLLFPLAACGSREQSARPRNLLLISIDTLRADRLGCYGYERETTPNLDRLASQGALFEQASAPSPWTLPSHASMFTGLAPRRHGAMGLKSQLQAEVSTMAELLVQTGFQAHAVVSSTVMQASGLERGFESLQLVEMGGPEPSGVTPACIAKLKQLQADKPFFLLAHYIDPHTDYGSLEPYRSRFIEPYEGRATGVGNQLYRAVSGALQLDASDVRHLSNLYDGGVAQVDAQVEELLAFMRAAKLLEQTLVLVTSDHGEEFHDHGGLMHGFHQHQELVRVPLILAGPGIPRGFRSAQPVSLMDVLPTCFAALGMALPEGLDGIALQALWKQPESQHPGRAFYYEADWDAPLPGRKNLSKGHDRALRVGDFKLHLNQQKGAVQLYDLSADPLELHDLSASEPQIVQALLAQLQHYLETEGGSGQALQEAELNAEDLKLLKVLGYAGDGDEEEQDER